MGILLARRSLGLRFRIGGRRRREGTGNGSLIFQIAGEQRLERNHGIPDFLQLVDRGLLVSGGLTRLSVAEVIGGGRHAVTGGSSPALQQLDSLLQLG